MGSALEVPPDWYRSGFPPITAAMPWADRTEAEVDRAIMMLRPEGGERVLDLACGIGRHSLELRRRGFEVVGVDISPELLAMAEREAAAQSLEVSFMQADLRELDLADEFDLVLSLNDGAVGYFETDEENRRTFEVIARALRAGGGHLMQLPNVLHAERNLPKKSWIVGEVELTQVGLHEGDLERLRGGLALGHRQQLGGDVDPDHLEAAPPQLQRVAADPAGEVENPLTALGPQHHDRPVDFGLGAIRPRHRRRDRRKARAVPV